MAITTLYILIPMSCRTLSIPQSFCVFFDTFNNSLSCCYASMNMRLSIGSWATYQWPQLLKGCLSFSQARINSQYFVSKWCDLLRASPDLGWKFGYLDFRRSSAGNQSFCAFMNVIVMSSPKVRNSQHSSPIVHLLHSLSPG